MLYTIGSCVLLLRPEVSALRRGLRFFSRLGSSMTSELTPLVHASFIISLLYCIFGGQHINNKSYDPLNDGGPFLLSKPNPAPILAVMLLCFNSWHRAMDAHLGHLRFHRTLLPRWWSFHSDQGCRGGCCLSRDGTGSQANKSISALLPELHRSLRARLEHLWRG